jgi:adenylate cyclase, class 2
MAKEIEAKFLNISKVELIKKLEDIGAQKAFDERILRRCVYNLPINNDNAWVRVRDEVDKITMSYKKISSFSLSGVEEIELTIDSFENARNFLKSVGLIEKAYQENKRLRYVLHEENVEFDIDTWPGLAPCLEIEADSETKVKHYADLLGFDWKDATFGSIDYIYEKIFDVTSDWVCNECPVLTFDNIPTQLTNSNLRNN